MHELGEGNDHEALLTDPDEAPPACAEPAKEVASGEMREHKAVQILFK